jgi:hypothetical protein
MPLHHQFPSAAEQADESTLKQITNAQQQRSKIKADPAATELIPKTFTSSKQTQFGEVFELVGVEAVD